MLKGGTGSAASQQLVEKLIRHCRFLRRDIMGLLVYPLCSTTHRNPDTPLPSASKDIAPVVSSIRPLTTASILTAMVSMPPKVAARAASERSVVARLAGRPLASRSCCAEARRIVDDFHVMIRTKDIAQLDPRVAEASPSLITSFARGITNDKRAIRAAITQPWSNGQVEGQITKLKLIKRQMYGRARLELLQARLIGAT
ncbi:MAG TPA: transposase [Devosia sp.]|nr:transposase [Devosia sp.]